VLRALFGQPQNIPYGTAWTTEHLTKSRTSRMRASGTPIADHVECL
jgi:hypothetical protein